MEAINIIYKLKKEIKDHLTAYNSRYYIGRS